MLTMPLPPTLCSLASKTLYQLNHKQFVRKFWSNSILGLVCTKSIVLMDCMLRNIIDMGVFPPLVQVVKDYSTINKITCFHFNHLQLKSFMTLHLKCITCHCIQMQHAHNKMKHSLPQILSFPAGGLKCEV